MTRTTASAIAISIAPEPAAGGREDFCGEDLADSAIITGANAGAS
jgi:hypothetical protein